MPCRNSGSQSNMPASPRASDLSCDPESVPVVGTATQGQAHYVTQREWNAAGFMHSKMKAKPIGCSDPDYWTHFPSGRGRSCTSENVSSSLPPMAVWQRKSGHFMLGHAEGQHWLQIPDSIPWSYTCSSRSKSACSPDRQVRKYSYKCSKACQ